MAMTGDPQWGVQQLQGVVSGTLYTTGNTTFGGVNTNQWWIGWQPCPADLQRQQQQAAQQSLDHYTLTLKNTESQPQKEQAPMRGLFEVFVVAPESGEIVKRDVVVADSDKKAELKVMRSIDVDPDDVDIIVRRLGDVRPKRKVQEVKVVKE